MNEIDAKLSKLNHLLNEAQNLEETMTRRLAAMDLNLLVVFSVLMHEQSVTGAAKRLFVGQSAVSASLKRLRTLFGDPLFVKAGRGMVPTERALQILPAINQSLMHIHAFTFAPPSFDPAKASVTLRIGMSDDNEIVFLPAIIRALQKRAPHIRVIARPVSHLNICTALDSGDVDVGMSVFGELSNWHASEVLHEQGYGCLYDRHHHQESKRLTLKRYLQSQQVIVTFDGALEGKIDRILAAQKVQREVQIGTTRFATLPHLVKGSNLVASLPELIGRVLAKNHGLAFCALPFEVPPGLPRLAWHKRNDADPINQWLRKIIIEAVQKEIKQILS
ncbi:MAG: LysR family transcriptional regulator [Burkholderiaceae bacterium]|nr:LysR family transcriptional regulator [Burkholderiaceae bacterium]